jgi:hypothetical protein
MIENVRLLDSVNVDIETMNYAVWRQNVIRFTFIYPPSKLNDFIIVINCSWSYSIYHISHLVLSRMLAKEDID